MGGINGRSYEFFFRLKANAGGKSFEMGSGKIRHQNIIFRSEIFRDFPPCQPLRSMASYETIMWKFEVGKRRNHED